MKAISRVFYSLVKKGEKRLEDIKNPTIRKEVEELLELDEQKEQEQSGGGN